MNSRPVDPEEGSVTESLLAAARRYEEERQKEPEHGWGNSFDLETTYGARARSNWFRVRDPGEFREFCETWGVIPEYRPELDLYGVRCPYGIPASEEVDGDPPTGIWIDFSKELGKQLAPGCMAVVRCIKWTKGMYEAEAFIIDSQGNDQWLDLDDILSRLPYKDGLYTTDICLDEWQTAHFSPEEIARRTKEEPVELYFECPECGFDWGMTLCTEDRKEQTIAWYHENWQPIGCLGCDRWWEPKDLIWNTRPRKR